MTMKEYVVGLKEGVDYDTFWQEIETNGIGSSTVPTRGVDVVDDRSVLLKSCVYALTDQEAETLRNDLRVSYVQIPVEQTEFKVSTSATQTGTYSKISGNPPTDGINWGLFRLNSTTNNTSGTTTGSGTYDYPLDGSGVDFVIMDSGIQADHPEFNNLNGASRVQKINWFTLSGVSGTQPADNLFYNDTDGHGTHCAGIAAGLTYGRAKNSNVFSILLDDLKGPGTAGLTVSQAFQVLKGWHVNKNTPGNPYYTGRPTVVNMSFGYFGLTFSNITSITYQGATTVTSIKDPLKGMIGNSSNRFGWWSDSFVSQQVQDLVTECINVGIIFCGAAGNTSQTIENISGNPANNYNNYFTSSVYGDLYYMRGMVPTNTPGVINVGAVDTTNSPQQKTTFSESGPRVDVWAPGQYIVSSLSTTYILADWSGLYGANTYPGNSSFNIGNTSGTSQASPQVAGLCAQLLQLYPTATPAQIRQKVIDLSTADVLYTAGSEPTWYNNNRSLHGGPNRYAYQPFNSAINATVTVGSGTFTNITLVNT